MIYQNRREFILTAGAGLAGAALLTPLAALAADPCAVDHPLSPPKADLPGQCPNCGMLRPMWARTWRTFKTAAGASQACSFHCLADMALKAGEDPADVKVALYQDPYTLVPAESAFFVVGSKAKGTMTMQSKLAFASRAQAEAFAAACGGRVTGYAETLSLAKAAVQKENQMIVERRLKKGKIVEPVDPKDRCPVCGMYPARFPKHKCQIQGKDQRVYHFCSTQCLFRFLEDPVKFEGKKVAPFLIWVKDFRSGAWISGRTAYYVLGSSQEGPMGKEAIVFDRLADAKQFAAQKGGRAVIFGGVSVAAIIE